MIDKTTKRNILRIILSRDGFLGKYALYDGLLAFLSKIWPLRDMPAKDDSRYSNQYDNIFQHRINNSDWTDDQLYEGQLNLIDGEDKYYQLFLECVVSPETRNSKDEIIFYVAMINKELENSNEKLILSDYFEQLPVYKLKEKEKFNDLPLDILSNRIPFFLGDDNIDIYPCFTFRYDRWDDYTYVTQMILYYRDSRKNVTKIGAVKIMKRGQKETWDALPHKFIELERDCCSLGQSQEYYEELKTHFPDSYQSILLALRDVAVFPKILEEFENDDIYRSSLTRDNDPEKLVRTIRYKLQGNLTEYYKFSYNYKPPYSEKNSIIQFNFDYEKDLPHRMLVMIGKNGAGKTSILSSLAKELSLQNPEFISPKKPLYSKFFTVSYSFFDRFEIPEQNAGFNYVYCGLKSKDGNLITEEEQVTGFLNSIRKIIERELIEDWYNILMDFLPEDQLNQLVTKESEEESSKILSFNETEFTKIRRQFSSGESIVLYILTKIISEIRLDSLILYDEPETHLHPNAISSLMNTLFKLVNRFKSFCILATHSPLIIQEIHARDIIILKRENNELLVRKMDKDSFGENLTVITEEIFNNRDINKHHLELMREFVEKGRSFEEILSIFQYEKLPINLSTRLYIKSLITERDDQS